MMKISFADLGLLQMSQVRLSLQKALNIHWSTQVRKYVRLIAPDLKSCGITVGELPPDASLKGNGAENE